MKLRSGSKQLLFAVAMVIGVNAMAQAPAYSTANAHSHNDYEQDFPFSAAWKNGFGSIEADIFLDNGRLIVAHEQKQVARGWTLDSLYLQPILQCIKTNKGYVYPDTTRKLQLMIDLKTGAASTLPKLVELLDHYPELTANRSLQLVVTGNKPPAADFINWPSWMQFDGDLKIVYTKEQLERVGLFSDNFARYSTWNGKGRLPQKEWEAIDAMVKKAHALGKKIRFWNAPDILNSWNAFIKLNIDYINTDHIEPISIFLKQLPDRTYNNRQHHELYQPRWRNDGSNKPIRNVILLIGDGTGLAQWYAGYTANKGALNVFNMHHTGLSKTSSYDNYITDSAPGATAFSSGRKTNNRAVGVDNTGHRLQLLPAIIRKRGMKTGIITSGDLRDATPAAFYAHRPERSDFAGIVKDLIEEPVDVIAGACDLSKQDSLAAIVKSRFDYYTSINDIDKKGSKPLFIADPRASLPVLNGKGDWALQAFQSTVKKLSENSKGFLLVLEGAQIDHGGHANKLPYAVSELLDFDKVIGAAMQFADSNGETLIIVTGDHETGGLTLTGGDYEQGYIAGQFSTGDHTAVPVPVFAYGPQSQRFGGVYENTDIFFRLLQSLGLK